MREVAEMMDGGLHVKYSTSIVCRQPDYGVRDQKGAPTHA